MGALNVKVKYYSGGPKKGAAVVGEVGGLFGGMTKRFYTDRDGHAVVDWSSNTTLKAVYVDGRRHDGPFRSGQTYVFPGR